MPNLRLSWSDPATFTLQIGVSAPSLAPPYPVGKTSGADIEKAVHAARKFLVALCIAGSGVFTWRAVTTTPRGARVLLPGETDPREVELASEHLTLENAPTLHLGFLFGAIDVLTKLGRHEWSPRFFSLYLRGVELLDAGGDFLGTYFEEAYLCFYRCIEYAVMVKILDHRGQFNERHFADAVLAIGAQPQDRKIPEGFAREILRHRNTAVAHFLKGSQHTEVHIKDVSRVKDALDVLVSEYVKHTVRMEGRSDS